MQVPKRDTSAPLSRLQPLAFPHRWLVTPNMFVRIWFLWSLLCLPVFQRRARARIVLTIQSTWKIWKWTTKRPSRSATLNQTEIWTTSATTGASTTPSSRLHKYRCHRAGQDLRALALRLSIVNRDATNTLTAVNCRLGRQRRGERETFRLIITLAATDTKELDALIAVVDRTPVLAGKIICLFWRERYGRLT